MINTGKIHIYTGDGKGKTTAALGLTVRAVGAGMKVFIGQFVKGMHYAELDTISEFLPQIILRQNGRNCFIENEPSQKDIDAAVIGFKEITGIMTSRQYDLVILDEIFIAIHYKLIPVSELISLLKNKPSETEVILTGRKAPEELIKIADLVTEMKEIKHYYRNGIQARKGIEF